MRSLHRRGQERRGRLGRNVVVPRALEVDANARARRRGLRPSARGQSATTCRRTGSQLERDVSLDFLERDKPAARIERVEGRHGADAGQHEHETVSDAGLDRRHEALRRSAASRPSKRTIEGTMTRPAMMTARDAVTVAVPSVSRTSHLTKRSSGLPCRSSRAKRRSRPTMSPAISRSTRAAL